MIEEIKKESNSRMEKSLDSLKSIYQKLELGERIPQS